jgi:subtilisin family serine protease
MKKNTPSEFGFLNLRTLVACACFFAACLLAYFSFAAPTSPNNNASSGGKSAPADWRGKVDPAVLSSAASGQTEFIISLTPAADLRGARLLTTKEGKGRYVFETLTAAAEATQPAVKQTLNQLGAEYRAFWIANVIWAKGNLAVIQAVAALPQVASISPSSTGGVKLPPQPATPGGTTQSPTSPDAVTAIEPNIILVNADDVWAMGYLGQNAVIAGADTGVRWTHNLLKNHYRGWNGTSADHNYNWHDAIHNPNTGCPADSPEPCDDDSLLGGGHGSHTMGTMVGDDGGANRTGMAPEAKWIACRNMNNGVGVVPTYLECMQFFMAPTNSAGANPDPSKAPHVINNSWGCLEPGCSPEPNPPAPGFMRATLQASRAAGIVYVVSAGNDGNGGTGDCSTVQFPLARYPESFTVGATSHVSDLIADFSSRGPVLGDNDFPPPAGLRKPDISAPGVGVRSAQRANDSAYGSLSGTSMAGPHVAGLVALVISANPSLAGNVDRIEEIIEQSAVPKTTAQACGDDTANTSVPNNVYGWGRIDALAAVTMALADLGCPVPDFVDDLEPAQGSGWTFEVAQNDTTPPSPTWAWMSDPNAHSPTHSFFSDSSAPLGIKDDRLIAPPQDLSATSHLIFWHQFKFEAGFDGGVLEVSNDGGNTWVDVLAGGGSFISGGYNDSIDPDLGSPIAGRAAWSGISDSAPTAMDRVEVDLGTFAGNGVLVRWRLVLDDLSIDPGIGWWVDDIEFTNLACELPAPTPNLVFSRKIHGAAGPFDIPLPLTGDPGIECRTDGVTQVVLIFGQPVTFSGAEVTSGTGTVASTSGSGTNQATINLTGVTNIQTITVTLLGVSAGGASADIPVPIGVLLGDTTANRSVNASDIGQTKAQSGQTTSGSNFRLDVNINGVVNASDIGLVKSQSGTSLP